MQKVEGMRKSEDDSNNKEFGYECVIQNIPHFECLFCAPIFFFCVITKLSQFISSSPHARLDSISLIQAQNYHLYFCEYESKRGSNNNQQYKYAASSSIDVQRVFGFLQNLFIQ